MKTKKFIGIVVLSLVLLSVLVACNNSDGTAASEEGVDREGDGEATVEMQTVLVTEAFHSLLYLPLYVGFHEGVFEEHSIDISGIRSSGTGPAALSSVLAGEAHFSVHGPEHVGFAKENGGEARAITAVANSAPVWVLASSEVEISSPEDLRNKHIVVGLAPGTSNTLIKRLLLDNGLDPETDVTITEVQNGSELGPVLAGQADVAVAYQPQVEQGISEGLEIVYDFTEDYPDYAFSTFNVALETIENDPALVERFVQAVQASLDLMHNQPEVAVEVAKIEFPELGGEVLEAAVNRMLEQNVYPQEAEINEKAFETAIEMQQFVGNIQGEMLYEDIVDSSFTD